MEKSYPKDFGTILGNCRNMLFLGSSDYDILKSVSEQVGKTSYSDDQGEQNVALVSVADLRRMKKEWEYKDALVISGSHLYCARLTDYEQYPFLKKGAEPVAWEQRVLKRELKVYTPEDLYEDVKNSRFPMTGRGEQMLAERRQREAACRQTKGGRMFSFRKDSAKEDAGQSKPAKADTRKSDYKINWEEDLKEIFGDMLADKFDDDDDLFDDDSLFDEDSWFDDEED